MGAAEQLRRAGGGGRVSGVDGKSAAIDIDEAEALAWSQIC